MIRIATIATSLLLITRSALAQNATLGGRITAMDGTPVPYATVALHNTVYGTITDEKGYYQIRDIKPGMYTMQASLLGKIKEEKAISLQPGDNATENLTIEASPEQLEAVMVQSRKIWNQASATSSKMSLSRLENPQVINVISADVFKSQNAVTVEDAMRNAPGVTKVWDATGRQGDGGAYYSSRGFHTQASLRNGITANISNTTDIANTERIEVIKGPSATLFGSQSNTNGLFAYGYGGLINRITKRPYEQFGGEVQVNAGNFDFYRGSIDLNTPLDPSGTLLFRITGSYTGRGSFQSHVSSRNIFLAPSLLFKPNDRLSLQVDAELAYGKNEGMNTMFFFYVFPPNALGYDRADQIRNIDYTNSYQGKGIGQSAISANYFAEVNYKLSAHISSRTNVAHSRSASEGRNVYFALLPDFFVTGDSTDIGKVNYLSQSDQSSARGGHNHVWQVQQNFNGDFKTGTLRHRALLGLDFTRVNSDIRLYGAEFINIAPLHLPYDYTTFDGAFLNNFYDTAAAYPYLFRYNIRSTTTIYSVYAADMLNITEQLALLASVRLNHYRNSKPETGEDFSHTGLSPKLGITWQPVKDRISLFANYQNSFNNLGFYPAYNASLDSVFSKTAKPEQANQMEAGIKTNLWQNRISIGVSYYHINVKNVLRTDATAGAQWAQIQDAARLSKGVELEIYLHPVKGLDITGGWAYNHSEYTKAAEDVQGLRPYDAGAPWSANWWVSYRLNMGLGLGFGGNYVSDNKVVHSRSDGTFTLPAYTVLNASASYEWKKLRLACKVDNITNRRYWVGWTTMNAQPLRQFVGSIAYKF